MPFTEINKLVRLFLLGSCGALLLILYLPELTYSMLTAAGLDKKSLAVPLGLVFLGFVTALGCVVEGFAQCTVGKLCQASLNRPRIASILLRGRLLATVNDWRSDFKEASRQADTFPISSRTLHEQQKSLAAGLLRRTAPSELVKYTDAHYGIFVLSSGLAVLFLGLFVPLFKFLIASHQPSIVCFFALAMCVLCVYALCSLALVNYLDIWETCFRYGCMVLWEGKNGGNHK